MAVGFALGLVPASVAAEPVKWQRYRTPDQAASVDIPVSIFSDDAGPAEGGSGRRFYRADHRADLTVTSIPSHASPAAFLAGQKPPSGIVYKKVTSDFFVVSSFRDDRIWYNRCNRSGQNMNCVLINYPAAEKRAWDGIVTRISHTLSF